jgi:hypothetical protein
MNLIYVTRTPSHIFSKSLIGYEKGKFEREKARIFQAKYRLATDAEVSAYLAKRGYKPEAEAKPKKKVEAQPKPEQDTIEAQPQPE